VSHSRKPFRMIPDCFIDACAGGEINERQFFLGCFLLRFASYKTGELSMTVAELAVRSGYELSPSGFLRPEGPSPDVGRVRVAAGPAHPLQVPHHGALGNCR
jgi:hypothetical protein